LFATAITLILVPAMYMILEDVQLWVKGLFTHRDEKLEPVQEK